MLQVNRSIMTTRQCYLNQNNPKWIVIHYTGCAAPAKNFALSQKNNNLGGTAHTFIDENSIYQSIEYTHGTWSVGDNNGHGKYLNGCTNTSSINLEMCCDSNMHVPSKTVENTAEYTAYLMKQYKININHICRHYDVSKKDCPFGWNNYHSSKSKEGGENTWIEFKNKVMKYYNGTSYVENITIPSTPIVDSVYEKAKSYNAARCKELQEKLIKCNYSCGSYGADGVYGRSTHNALGNFQADHGLTKDYLAGKNTFAKLDNIIANKNQQSSNDSVYEKAKSYNTARCKELQEKLIKCNYSCGSYGADGIYGRGTHNALGNFQADHGLTKDYLAGKNTFAKLDNIIANKNQQSSNNWILRLQKELNIQGFRDRNGNKLIEDGIAGSMTLSACPVVKKGAEGNITKLLQEKLTTLGYHSSGIDGIFGNGTQSSVIDFQKAKKLSADGIVGNNTWKKLLNL